MDYECEIENVNLDLYSFEIIQQIICRKIANVIIETEREICIV